MCSDQRIRNCRVGAVPPSGSEVIPWTLVQGIADINSFLDARPRNTLTSSGNNSFNDRVDVSAVPQLLTSRTRKLASRASHSDTALEILRVAILAFDEVGFSAASIGRIADDAGISKSLVTYYFPTKALIAAAILNQAYPGGVFMGLERKAADPLEAIAQAMDHVASSVAHDGLARVALKLRDEPELHHQGSPERLFGWLTRITDYLDEARRRGSICGETDVEAEARFMVAGVVGLIALAVHTSDFLFLVVDVATVTRQRIDMLTPGPTTDRVAAVRAVVLVTGS